MCARTGEVATPRRRAARLGARGRAGRRSAPAAQSCCSHPSLRRARPGTPACSQAASVPWVASIGGCCSSGGNNSTSGRVRVLSRCWRHSRLHAYSRCGPRRRTLMSASDQAVKSVPPACAGAVVDALSGLQRGALRTVRHAAMRSSSRLPACGTCRLFQASHLLASGQVRISQRRLLEDSLSLRFHARRDVPQPALGARQL